MVDRSAERTFSLPPFEVRNPPPVPTTGVPADPGCPRAWVSAVNMGLGHLRAAYPLTELTPDGILLADDPELISEGEVKLWRRMRRAYESFSRARKVPLVGGLLYSILHKVENISPYYPRRDLSQPTVQVKLLKTLLDRGLGSDLVERMREREDLPLVSTFYAQALAADATGYPRVYLVVTDTDINRVWVPERPLDSDLFYLTPCGYARNRLKQYGIPDERIIMTGFPLPRECVGREMGILRRDLGARLQVLDPNDRYRVVHRVEAEHYLGAENFNRPPDRPLTLIYAVGGAGAQTELGLEILESLREKVLARKIRVWLAAGVRPEVAEIFQRGIHDLGLENTFGPEGFVNILLGRDHTDYFRKFNGALRQTDLLWTKPSELSFYTGLGLPIIMAPPIGPHEDSNKLWLFEMGGGIDQMEPRYADQWLFDLLERGVLARAAMDGFLYARSRGTYKIEEVAATGGAEHEVSPLDR
ncbi:MAG: hypothetical protein R6W82_11620 [bacterium]